MRKHDIYSALSTEIEALAKESGRTVTNTTNALLRYALDQEKAGKISAADVTVTEKEGGGATVEFSGELATALLNKGFTPESLKEKILEAAGICSA